MRISGLFLASASGTALTNGLEIENLTAVKTSLADWIIQGGVMMIPILLGSVIALAIIIERVLFLRRTKLETRDLVTKVRRSVENQRLQDARVICENTSGPMAVIVKTVLENRGRSRDELGKLVEETAGREVVGLERYLPILGTIGTISPLLGLLGTVLGMIKSSNHLAIAGTSNPVGLIGGISEALITTAAGLFVAIPVVVCYNWFTGRVNHLILEMERETARLIDLLEQTTSKKGHKSE